MRFIVSFSLIASFIPSASFAQLYGDYSVRIEVEGNGFAHYSTVYFSGDSWATDGYDPCCEALMALGNSNQPHVYSQVIAQPIPSSNRMSINAFPLLVGEKHVPLGFLPGTLAQYSFTFKQLWTVPAGITVALEDVTLGVTQDLLSDSTYETWGAPSDAPDRFILHFNPQVTGIEEEQHAVSQRNVSWNADAFFITFNLSGAESRIVSIFDLSGRRLASSKLTKDQASNSVLLAQTGVHIIRVSDDIGHHWTEMVFVKNF